MKVVKICRVHGDLGKDDIFKESVKNDARYKADFIIRCQKCVNERNWQSYVKECHIHGNLKAEDVKANGRCKLCHRESANKKRNDNREWFNDKMAKDRESNPEKWDGIYKKAYQVKLKKFGRKALDTKEIIRMYGLTQDRYDRMFEEQNNLCAICGNPESRMNRGGKVARLTVDHCHQTNNVRGLLCHACNIGLGKFQDNIEIMFNAIAYLQEFS